MELFLGGNDNHQPKESMTMVDNIVAGQFRQAANTIHTQGIASAEKFGAQIISILPKPLVPPDCDCTNLDGFMLNVERLMASELVAISSHEVIAAAMFLWCRAWKQKPAASLPDNDKILASFARMPLARFKKFKADILHGFIKCSDGRYYHRYLSTEAIKAFEAKKAYQNKRDKDAERLRNWRNETRGETQDETRFVAERQGQGQRQGEGQARDRDSKEETNTQAHALASLACGAAPNGDSTDTVRQDFAGSEGKKANRGSNGNGEAKIATLIPVDLEPNDRDRTYGKSGGYEGGDFNRLWLSFKSHHQSKGDVSKDWHAEFAKYLCAAIDMAAERARARSDA
jgi:hypothetical protein